MCLLQALLIKLSFGFFFAKMNKITTVILSKWAVFFTFWSIFCSNLSESSFHFYHPSENPNFSEDSSLRQFLFCGSCSNYYRQGQKPLKFSRQAIAALLLPLQLLVSWTLQFTEEKQENLWSIQECKEREREGFFIWWSQEATYTHTNSLLNIFLETTMIWIYDRESTTPITLGVGAPQL